MYISTLTLVEMWWTMILKLVLFYYTTNSLLKLTHTFRHWIKSKSLCKIQEIFMFQMLCSYCIDHWLCYTKLCMICCLKKLLIQNVIFFDIPADKVFWGYISCKRNILNRWNNMNVTLHSCSLQSEDVQEGR